VKHIEGFVQGRLEFIGRMMVCALVVCVVAACSSMPPASDVEAVRLVSEARIVLLNFVRDPNQNLDPAEPEQGAKVC
jgi:hypothetical protein